MALRHEPLLASSLDSDTGFHRDESVKTRKIVTSLDFFEITNHQRSSLRLCGLCASASCSSS